MPTRAKGRMRYLPAITIWTLTLAALALAALVLVGCGDQGESELTDTFAVGQRPRVIIESFGGTIEVRAGADGVVRVDSTLRNPQRIDFAASGTQDEVSVRARRADGISIGSFPVGVAMVVTVPAAADLDVTALNGEIHLSGVDGDTALRASNGPVTVAESSGDLVVTVGTGAIRMVAFTGQAVLSTSSGSITATVADGTFNFTASNGSISFEGWFTPGSTNAFRTSNGSVNVEVFDPDLRLDLATDEGRVGAPPLDNIAVAREEALVGDLGDGSSTLLVRTSNGDITVREP
jgi:DUF4097 and DUF4098 domain-containing protein YvlB